MRMNLLGTFRIPTTVTEDGLAKVVYSDGGTVWCKAEDFKGRWLWEAQQDLNEQTVFFRIRYVNGVKTDWRFRVENVDYSILDINDVDLKHQYLILTCRVVKS